MVTDNQLIHRAYLCSAAWKAKRLEALGAYGCICNRCGEHGTDVHHKTYERVGGLEKLEDLEVLCRDCHIAHHDAERSGVREKGRRIIHRRAIYDKLTAKHAEILFKEFPNAGSDLFYIINYGDQEIADRAAQLLGFSYAYGQLARKGRSRIGDCRQSNPKDFVVQSLHDEPLGFDMIERKKKVLAEKQLVIQMLVMFLKSWKRP